MISSTRDLYLEGASDGALPLALLLTGALEEV